MKRYVLLFFLSGFLIVSCGQTKTTHTDPGETSDRLDLRVKVEGTAGQNAKMLGVFGDQNYIADSAKVGDDGTAVFKKDSLMPGGLYYIVYPGNKFVQMILDKDQEFNMVANASDIINTMVVKGSLDNELFYKNLKFEDIMKPKFAAAAKKLEGLTEGTFDHQQAKMAQDKLLDQRYAHIDTFRTQYPNSFFTIFKLAGQNPKVQEPKLPSGEVDIEMQRYLYKKDFWNDVDLTDERLLHTPVIANKLKRYITEVTLQRIDSVIQSADFVSEASMGADEMFKFVVNWIAIKYKKPEWMGAEAIFTHMILKYWTPELAFWSDSTEIRGLRRDAQHVATSLLGKPGLDVNAKNLKGEYESIHSLAADIVVVYIYTTNCEHCQEETPRMLKVYNEWKNRGVDVYAICTDTEYDKWKKFVNNYGIGAFHNVYDPTYESQYHLKYHIDITPECYVLNKDRTIIGRNLKPLQLPDIFQREFDGETRW